MKKRSNELDLRYLCCKLEAKENTYEFMRPLKNLQNEEHFRASLFHLILKGMIKRGAIRA